jgi:hypothetical protein
MPIVVLGSINTDLVIRSPALPSPGETVLGGEFYQAAKGRIKLSRQLGQVARPSCLWRPLVTISLADNRLTDCGGRISICDSSKRQRGNHRGLH